MIILKKVKHSPTQSGPYYNNNNNQMIYKFEHLNFSE